MSIFRVCRRHLPLTAPSWMTATSGASTNFSRNCSGWRRPCATDASRSQWTISSEGDKCRNEDSCMPTVKSVDKMICPQCAVEMNHNCDKLVYGIGQEIMPPMNVQTEPDLLLGGVIGEF